MKIQKYSKAYVPIEIDNWDLRFSINRIFEIRETLFKYRIRFVQYPNCGKEEVKVFITRIFRMPKFYWNHIEKTMKPPFFHNWLFKSREQLMSFSEVYDKFGYELESKSRKNDA